MENGKLNNPAQKELLSDFLQQWQEKKGIKAKTSGSTGIPKEIQLSHEMVERSARRTVNFFNIKKKSRIHSAISFEFIGGKMMIARSLVSGCRFTFSPPSLTPVLQDAETPIDLMSVVPAQMNHILDHPEQYDCVRSFLLGGSAIDSRLWDRIVSLRINAWESYGMTETASHVALRRISGSSSSRPRFIPLPGVWVKTDSEGRIHIRDEKTFFTTNDYGESFPDGSFNVLGRLDDIIISGGIKINPFQVEDILREFISDFMDDFFISSLPDEQWTSKIILVGHTSQSLDQEEKMNLIKKINNVINNISNEILPSHYRPKEVLLKDKLLYTLSGKLVRKIQ